MLHLSLQSPVEFLWFGEFVSPNRQWKHLTRALYEYELMIVTEGILYIADEKEAYEIHAGEYLIMSPTRLQHGTKPCSCRFYWMHFRCPSSPSPIAIPSHGAYSSEKVIQFLADLLFKAECDLPQGIRSRYLATQLLLQLASIPRSGEAHYPSADQAITDKIKSYVQWHRFSDIRVSEIARALGYHEKYISAVFRKTEGIPLKRYLIAERLGEAKRLLLDTNYSISEVAYYLNFENPNNFSRFFKAETGVSPLAFRKNPPAAGG